MREYGTVAFSFWTSGTGKVLRDDRNARDLALYLMTCQDSTVCGVFRISHSTMQEELGLSEAETTAALARLEREDFLRLDAENEVVWVINLAHYQLAKTMVSKDKRYIAFTRSLEAQAKHPFREACANYYREAYNLGTWAPSSLDRRPLPPRRLATHPPLPKGASEAPLTPPSDAFRTEQDRTDQGSKKETPAVFPKNPLPEAEEPRAARAAGAKAHRLPEGWTPTLATIQHFREQGIDHADSLVRFTDHWLAASGKTATKVDWEAAFRNWVREDMARGRARTWRAPPPPKPPEEVREPAVPCPPEILAQLQATFDSLEEKSPMRKLLKLDVGEEAFRRRAELAAAASELP